MLPISLLKKYFSATARHLGKTNSRHNTKRTSFKTFQLSDEQRTIYNLIENTNDNMYVTGKAGTGKSLLLRYFVKHTTKTVVVLAPTGVAALNAGGMTIHSFFKFFPGTIDPAKVRVDYKTRELLQSIDAIVIDEISMVSVDVMESINSKLQIARHNVEPFGGVQMVMFGDLYQLPPVISDKQVYRHLKHTYGGTCFFNAPVFKLSELRVYELDKAYRQKDPAFRTLLNAIREGDSSDIVLDQINKRVTAIPQDGQSITLTATNVTASAINRNKLNALPSKERIYSAAIEGDIRVSSFPTDNELELKVGAQIMLLKNDLERPMRWANGTLAVVTKLNKSTIHVRINEAEYVIQQATWETVRYVHSPLEGQLQKEVVGMFTQIPVRLAWAITIHKSQGQTYESVALDIGNGAFMHGQTYVALSRCTHLDGLYLATKIMPEDIIIDPSIVSFMNSAVHTINTR